MDAIVNFFAGIGTWYKSIEVVLLRLCEAFVINCELFFVTLLN